MESSGPARKQTGNTVEGLTLSIKAEMAKVSSEFKLNMVKKLDRNVQILQGRRKESLADPDFWDYVALAGIYEDVMDPIVTKLFVPRLKSLYEAVAKYLTKLFSLQQRTSNFQEVSVMLANLERVRKKHSTYEQVLQARGVYEAFENYILTRAPEEDITLMSLAFSMLFGYRNCKCCYRDGMIKEHKERLVTFLAKCVQASAKLDSFLRLGLACSIPRLIVSNLPRISFGENFVTERRISEEVSGLVIKHGLATFAFQHLTAKENEILNVPHTLDRKLTAAATLVRVPEYCPSFVAVCRETDLFIPCTIAYFESFAFASFCDGSADIFCESYKSYSYTLGPRAFHEKFVPQLMRKLPDDFLVRLYGGPDKSSATSVRHLEPAAGFFQVGRFNAHDVLAPVIVEMFNDDHIQLMRYTWDFLHGAYAVPTFKEECFKSVPGGCDPTTLEIIRSVIDTHWVPSDGTYSRDKYYRLNISLTTFREDGAQKAMEKAMEMCPNCHLQCMFDGLCTRVSCACYDPARNHANEFRVFDFEIDTLALIRGQFSDGKPIARNGDEEAKQKQKQAVATDEAHGSVEKYAFDKDSTFVMSCNTCGRRAVSLMLCGGCQQALYCNRDCQKADWKKGHKQVCRSFGN